MNTDITTAFIDCVLDTEEKFYSDPLYKKGTGTLTTSYTYLAQVTGLPMQVLLDNISLAVHNLCSSSDHTIAVRGEHARELSCETCGRLLSAHAGYEKFHEVISDLEAVSALLAHTPQSAITTSTLPKW